MFTAMSHARNRSLARLLAGVLAGSSALVALAVPAPASAATASKSPSGTQTIPLPASAKAQPGAAGGAVAPTSTHVPSAAATPAPGAATTGTTPAAPSTQRSGTPNSAQARGHGTGKLSTAAIVLAALAALLALGCAAWGIARLQAYEPHWARSARHAVAEAGVRVSATWAEFSDWIRLGH
jgi:hypothetical protein